MCLKTLAIRSPVVRLPSPACPPNMTSISLTIIPTPRLLACPDLRLRLGEAATHRTAQNPYRLRCARQLRLLLRLLLQAGSAPVVTQNSGSMRTGEGPHALRVLRDRRSAAAPSWPDGRRLRVLGRPEHRAPRARRSGRASEQTATRRAARLRQSGRNLARDGGHGPLRDARDRRAQLVGLPSLPADHPGLPRPRLGAHGAWDHQLPSDENVIAPDAEPAAIARAVDEIPGRRRDGARPGSVRGCTNRRAPPDLLRANGTSTTSATGSTTTARTASATGW